MELVKSRYLQSMASSIKDQMKPDDDPIISPEACIFRTPSILKRHNYAAFVPNAFSIGPFHHGKEELIDAQRIKLKYLQGLVERKGSETMLDGCIDAIKVIVDKARSCYNGEIAMSDQGFIEMLVLDGCFIIELFRKDGGEVPTYEGDPIFNMSCMLQFLHHDLIMLENQIPWFVLDKLFSLTRAPYENKTLIELALEFFDNIFSSEKEQIEPSLFANQEIKHILDLLRTSLVLPLEKLQDQPLQSTEVSEPLPSASIMAESGIKFMKVTSQSILDLRFTKGAIKMPPLLIQETIEPAFRNLISYEQCYPNIAPRVTCYAILLDNLIQSTADIDELSWNGIFKNWLPPSEAKLLFKMLYQDAYVKEFYHHNLCIEVRRYRHTWKAFYIRHFGQPWAIVSQIVAAIVLVAIIVQTVFAVNPGNK